MSDLLAHSRGLLRLLFELLVHLLQELLLLLWVTVEPYITRRVQRYGVAPITLPEAAATEATAAAAPIYQRILVPLDHTAAAAEITATLRRTTARLLIVDGRTAAIGTAVNHRLTDRAPIVSSARWISLPRSRSEFQLSGEHG